MPRYIVMTSSASVSQSRRQWGGQYRNVAVVELEPVHAVTAALIGTDPRPSRISERSKGVQRIVRQWHGCRVGTTDRSQYAVALAEANALANQLNNDVVP